MPVLPRAQSPGALSLGRLAVRLRRLLVRHPILYWVAVVVVIALAANSVRGHVAGVDAARDRWGIERSVLVATRSVEPGDPLRVERRRMPAPVVPPAALEPGAASEPLTARQRVTAGEIVTSADVGGPGPLALAPAGSLVVTVAESLPSGAATGERVWLVSEGVVLTRDALVIEAAGELTRVAVPESAAPAASVAAANGDLVVVRSP